MDMLRMIRGAGWIYGFVALCAIVSSLREGRTEVSPEAYATKFFLDGPPSAVDKSKLPATARDVIIAKVRIVGDLIYLVPRDESGYAASPPKDLFLAQVEFVDVLAGAAVTGKRYEVYFGFPGVGRMEYPHTPTHMARDYFVISYRDGDGRRRLVGYPVSEREYVEWGKEISDYERKRTAPGARER